MTRGRCLTRSLGVTAARALSTAVVVMSGAIVRQRPAAAAPRPDDALRGPSLTETGRMAAMPTVDPLSRIERSGPADAIAPGAPTGVEPERSVSAAAAALDVDEPPPKAGRGTLNRRAFEREAGDRLAALDDCRVAVARQKRITPAEVEASALLLRWTIQPDGRVDQTEVVATKPVDPAVMDCIKSTMAGWTFTPPTGGPVSVERALVFRALGPPPAATAPPSGSVAAPPP